MIRIDQIETFGWETAIRGMRNPMNSWEKSDSGLGCAGGGKDYNLCFECSSDYVGCTHKGAQYIVGQNDLELMLKLAKSGSDHAKFRRMINVTMDILAPLYWWKEFDTYKVGTVANSTSTMHKIHAREFGLADFSYEHLSSASIKMLESIIRILNQYRNVYCNWDNLTTAAQDKYLSEAFGGPERNKKRIWWQMIQLLPSSYNQLRTVQLNYEVLANIYHARKDHKLDEWREFCKMIEGLPYSQVIMV